MNFITKSILIIIVLISSIFSMLNGQDLTQFPALLEINDQFRDQAIGVSEYTTLSIDESIRRDLKTAKPKTLKLNIPLNDHKTFELELERFKVASDDFILKTSEGDIVDYEPGVYYKGKIVGEEGFATLGISGNHIMGIISTKRDGNYNFGKMKDSDDYVIFNSKDFLRNSNIECHTPEPEDYVIEAADMVSNSESRSLSDCVKLYIEGDNDLRINKGGVSEASDYIMDIISVVAVIYDNESINTEISEIMVWTSPDGYDTNNSGTALNQFENNNPNPNGDLAHLFALGGNGTGGLAWVDVLCGGPNYAYSNISSWYNDFPTYSWTIEVVTHEMGHNIGSPHTHSCSWSGGAIDNCYATEGSCSPGPAPTNGGTIMSYCHLTASGINFNNGFGPLPGDLIRNRVSSAGCLGPCTGGVLAPTADFTMVPGDGCAPSVVQFFDNSTNGPTGWEWEFEGGTPATSTDQNPTITFIDQGEYDVTLMVTNGGGSDEITEYDFVIVITEPIVDFTYVVDEKTVDFSNITTGANDYYWSYGDGENSTEENPEYTYEEDGVYLVTLLASNDCGAPLVNHTVTIATAPTADFSVQDTSGCADYVVIFDNNSSSNVDTYQWSFPGGDPLTSTDTIPTVSYSTEGDFDVELIVTNAQGTDTMFLEDYITVLTYPEAIITSNVNGAIVSLSAPSYTGASYLWDFGDGTSSTVQDTTHQYATEDTFNITLITSNALCADTSEVSVIILFTPTVLFSADITEDCSSLTVNFTNETSGTGNTYLWAFPGADTESSTEENPTVTYGSPGTYDVSLTATNSSGTTVLEEIGYITVYAVPNVDMEFEFTDLVVDFNNLTTAASGYSWDFGDGNTSTEEHPTNTYTEEGVFVVTLSATYPCGVEENTFEVNIYTQPTAGYSAVEVSGCTPLSVSFNDESSDNAVSWLWSFTGGTPESSTEQNPVVIYETDGFYDVSLTVTNPSGSNTFTNENYITVDPLTASDYGWLTEDKVVTFENGSINADNFTWQFGDGTTSIEESPIHTYLEYGVYNVSLEVSGPCGEDTVSYDVYLQADAVENTSMFSQLSIYPNPVNDILILDWTSTELTDVGLTIYNIYGQEIMTDLIEKNQDNVKYKLDVNRMVPGGYILKLSTDKAQRVEKIVVY